MAYEIPGFTFTLPAAADLSASQYCAVVTNSSGQAALQTAATDITGILLNKPSAAGIAATIQVNGVAKVKAGAAIATIGTRVMADGAGKAIVATSTNKAFGIALAAAGGANEVIPVLLKDLGTF